MAFKMPPQAPPNFNYTPASTLTSIRAIIDHSHKLQDELVAKVRPEDATFDNVLLPLAEDENRTIALKKLFKFFSSTSTSEGLRNASNVCDALVTEFESQTLMREDLFQLIDAVSRREERLEEESQLYLDQMHQAFLRNGLGIADVQDRNRFTVIKKELQELRVVYLKSLNTSNGIWLTAEELNGLPIESLTFLKIGDGENAGKVVSSFQETPFGACIAVRQE
jgi:metallopeptidase MepB